MPVSGNLPHTQIKIEPTGSHAFLVTLAVIGGVCLVSGFGMLVLGLSIARAAIPVVIGLILIAVACVAWWKSHRDIDLKNSVPITITDPQTGMQLITDPRAVAAPEMVRHTAALLHALAHRHPLPEPDGLVDELGAPIPETKPDAIAQVDAVNAQIESGTMQTIATLAGVEDETAVEHPLALDHPGDKSTLELNRPKVEGD